jgi:hypothetical protein
VPVVHLTLAFTRLALATNRWHQHKLHTMSKEPSHARFTASAAIFATVGVDEDDGGLLITQRMVRT